MEMKLSDFRIVETEYRDGDSAFTIERKCNLLKFFGITYWYVPTIFDFITYTRYDDALTKVKSLCEHNVKIHTLE
jgi:hypothetical protein